MQQAVVRWCVTYGNHSILLEAVTKLPTWVGISETDAFTWVGISETDAFTWVGISETDAVLLPPLRTLFPFSIVG